MEERHIKIVLGILILFLLDLIKPLGHFLQVELLFLGIIFLALNYSLFVSLGLSILAGYAKDCLVFSDTPLNLIEFPLICVFIYYFRSHFLQTKGKIFAVIFALILHIILHTLQIDALYLWFSVNFFIQSITVFALVNYLLRKWLRILHESYI